MTTRKNAASLSKGFRSDDRVRFKKSVRRFLHA
jgi:hypothetical protein